MPQNELNSKKMESDRVDGILAALFYRKISKRITSKLVSKPLTPNQVSILSTILGILSSIFIAIGNYLLEIVGVTVLQISLLLDVVDGDLARAKDMKSAWGNNLDILSDRFMDSVLIIAVSIACYKHSQDDSILLWGSCAVAGYQYFHYLTDVWLFPPVHSHSGQRGINIVKVMGTEGALVANEALITVFTIAVIFRQIKPALILCTIVSLLISFLQIIRIRKMSIDIGAMDRNIGQK